MPRWSRLVVGGCLATASVLALPSWAAPHALVLESTPRHGEVLASSPGRIFLRFNNRIEPAASKLSVVESGGRTLRPSVVSVNGAPDRLVAPLGYLAPGVYLVRWKVLAADGHLTEGVFRFTVAPSR